MRSIASIFAASSGSFKPLVHGALLQVVVRLRLGQGEFVHEQGLGRGDGPLFRLAALGLAHAHAAA